MELVLPRRVGAGGRPKAVAPPPKRNALKSMATMIFGRRVSCSRMASALPEVEDAGGGAGASAPPTPPGSEPPSPTPAPEGGASPSRKRGRCDDASPGKCRRVDPWAPRGRADADSDDDDGV